MNIIIEIIKCLLSGLYVGFYGFISALPIYNQLDGIKERLIAALTGLPVGLISAASLILLVSKVLKRIVQAI